MDNSVQPAFNAPWLGGWTAIEGRFGFLHAYSGEPKLNGFDARLGVTYMILQTANRRCRQRLVAQVCTETPERFAVRGSGVIRLESLGHDRIPPRSMSALLLSNRRRPDLRHAPRYQKGDGAAQHDRPRAMEGDLRSTYSRLFHYAGSDDDGCGGGREPPTRRQLH